MELSISNDHPSDVFVFNHGGYEYVTLREYERLRAMLHWIPVSKRLPQTDQPVLAYCCGEIGVCRRFSDGWYWDDEGSYQEIEPSHWRQLPEPPETK